MSPTATLLGLLLLLGQPAPAQTLGDSLDELLKDAHQLMKSGRYRDAEERLQTAESPQSLRLRLELADRRGDRDTARRLAERLYSLRLSSLRAEELGLAAVGAWWLDKWHEANDLFIEAAARPPVPASLYIDWGNLYLQQYNPGGALDSFQDALNANPQDSPPARWGLAAAHLGMALALDALSQPGADKALAKAADLDGDNLELLTYHAREALQGSNWKEAEQLLEKGLKINRNHAGLIRLKAAFHYFRFQEEEYQEARARALEINPVDADLFETLGDLCIPQRRLETAIGFYREAVRLNPRQWSALASLGINLLRIGQEAEGKQALELAYANDPFNLWTVNTLRLLDSFKNFTRFETPHFSVRIQTSEVQALRPYVEPLLERALTTLAAKYDFPVTGKYVFEMYAHHEDFAVRTLGMPGLGALGATFGRVVAMDSPSARPGGKFHWGSTLWHEVAHIVTLGLSEQKVPRWFTEGLSMMEERHSLEGWGDFLNIGFVKVYENGKLLSLSELDEGFQRPKFPGQLEISYFQAGWLCDFLASRYGSDKIRAMLVAYGQDKTTEQVFREVLGESVEEVDAEFKKEMDQVLKPLLPKLKGTLQTQAEEGLALDFSLDMAEADPGNYFFNLKKARELLKAQRPSEAVPYVQKAIEIFPTEAGEGSPYSLLAEIARQMDDEALELEALRKWWQAAPRFASTGLQLADLLQRGGHLQEAVATLEGVMYVDPLKAEPHRLLGELYLRTKEPQKALSELRILVSLAPPDIAGAHYLLAQALAETGSAEEARREVLYALEIAPTYAEAQKLLLKLVRP